MSSPRTATVRRLSLLGCVLFATACGEGLDTTRAPAARGTLGEELFGVLCDRLGAQTLSEDLSGASFRRICHKGPDGSYADRLAVQHLPSTDDTSGRALAVARLETLARHRARLIPALDTLFPEMTVPVKDLGNPSPALTCGPPGAEQPAEARLAQELGALLERMTVLYGDDTLPGSTRALGGWMESFRASPEALQAWAELNARTGYQPPERALGMLRPVLAWTGLRDFLDTATRTLGPSATGPTRQRFQKLLAATHHELRTLEPLAPSLPLRSEWDTQLGRELLSRPRTAAEWTSALLLTEALPSSGAPPVLAVRRDGHGLASMARAGGVLPAGEALPSPFPAPGEPATPRDSLGRALSSPGGAPVYEYLDTRRTLLAGLLSHARPLLTTAPGETQSPALGLLAGASVLSTRHPSGDTPALELTHALGQVLGEPSTEDLLALAAKLMRERPGDVARLSASLRALGRVADAHPEARLAPGSSFRDDLLDVLVKISREPGLLEDLLRALAHPDTQGLAPALSSTLRHRDGMTYDRRNLNGPPYNLTTGSTVEPRTPVDRTQPDAGLNRSLFQRFLTLMHDAHGVTFCNKQGAVVHGNLGGMLVDLPLFGGTYDECEVFKVNDMAVFYVQSIVGKAKLYLRPGILRDGVIGIGAADVGMMEDSSGITGFWTERSSRDLRPRPQWINRVLSFDQKNDSPTSSGPHHVTNLFLRDLVGTRIGGASCPERVIDDPDPYALDAAPDGKVRGLRACAEGNWFPQRAPDTLLMLETHGFYKAVTPVLTAFTKRNREDLLIEVVEVLHEHWASTKSGAVRYEPLVSEALKGDLLGGLQAVVKAMDAARVRDCTELDARTRQCRKWIDRDGISLLATGLRAVVDPSRSATVGVTDRKGSRTYVRQDGTTAPQVTPLVLLLQSMDTMDAALGQRRDAWRAGWSRVADEVLATRGEREATVFADPLVPALVPRTIELLRAELLVRCPDSWAPPYTRCAWARDALTRELESTLESPTSAATRDFLEALRQDGPLRTQVEALAVHLLDPAAPDEALPSLLTSAADGVQLLAGNSQRVPLARLLAEALRPEAGLVDAQLVLLGRVSGRVYAEDGAELCSQELDPNALVPGVLQRLVTPTELPGEGKRIPLEVFTEALADIQRVSPGAPGPRTAEDYGSISRSLGELLLSPDKGLERLYEVVRMAGRTP
jgi:hypothetical protein